MPTLYSTLLAFISLALFVGVALYKHAKEVAKAAKEEAVLAQQNLAQQQSALSSATADHTQTSTVTN